MTKKLIEAGKYISDVTYSTYESAYADLVNYLNLYKNNQDKINADAIQGQINIILSENPTYDRFIDLSCLKNNINLYGIANYQCEIKNNKLSLYNDRYY